MLRTGLLARSALRIVMNPSTTNSPTPTERQLASNQARISSELSGGAGGATVGKKW